jgi:hypothetical protein
MRRHRGRNGGVREKLAAGSKTNTEDWVVSRTRANRKATGALINPGP